MDNILSDNLLKFVKNFMNDILGNPSLQKKMDKLFFRTNRFLCSRYIEFCPAIETLQIETPSKGIISQICEMIY